MTSHNLVDETGICRPCGGEGVVRYPTGRGTEMAEDCPDCAGTGYKTVIVTPKEPGNATP